MTELELHRDTTQQAPAAPDDLRGQMDYARAVSTASLLPQAYRGKPADIMLAMGLGQSMGLSPAESLYRIDVIQGKPTASAELIAANVRKAGHKLRVRLDEAAVSASATIIRADDPDFEHTVTRDMEWARTMGLVGKDNYKKQPLTMLQHRAVTAVARLACPEALYGVTYTADELTDVTVTTDRPRRGLAEVIGQDQPEEPAKDEPVDAEEVPDAEPWALTDRTRGRLFALFTEQGITDRAEQIAGISYVIGRDITSRSEMTEDDARRCIEHLEARGRGQ